MRSVWAAFSVAAISFTAFGLAPMDEAAHPEFYLQRVKPILQNSCYRCHGGMNHRGSLNIETRAGMARGGKHGGVIVPGDPAHSLLVRLIRHEGPSDNPMPMPSKGAKLSDNDIATIEHWIRAGAIMPEDRPKP